VSERDQLREVCRWNRELDGENRRLREEVQRLRFGVRDLEATNAELHVEAEAADALLGAAMDEAARSRA
jgi:hypothetical protein